MPKSVAAKRKNVAKKKGFFPFLFFAEPGTGLVVIVLIIVVLKILNVVVEQWLIENQRRRIAKEINTGYNCFHISCLAIGKKMSYAMTTITNGFVFS
jgi:hypothetical protein